MHSMVKIAVGFVMVDASIASSADVQRAMSKVPRAQYRGSSSKSMNDVLNGHLLARRELTTRSCETFTLGALQQLLQFLSLHADSNLLSIYEGSRDERRHRPENGTWDRLNFIVDQNPTLHAKLRDGHCHQVVMAFVHHLPELTRKMLATKPGFVLPLLPREMHSKPCPLASQQELEIHKEYAASVGCQVCHGGQTPASSEENAPKWPPVVAPVWPYQFGAMTSAVTETNETLHGTWHYDFLNNRMAQYFANNNTGLNLTMIWLGNPAPDSEGPAEEVYGAGARRGVLHVFVSPAPGVTTCSAVSYPSFAIVHPDAFASAQIGSQNVKFVERTRVNGKWSDHFTYYFNISEGNPCNGLFELYMEVFDNLPVMDHGPNGCGPGKEATTTWWDVRRSEPEMWRFTQHDFTACAHSASLEELESQLLEHEAISGFHQADLQAALGAATRHLFWSPTNKVLPHESQKDATGDFLV